MISNHINKYVNIYIHYDYENNGVHNMRTMNAGVYSNMLKFDAGSGGSGRNHETAMGSY